MGFLAWTLLGIGGGLDLLTRARAVALGFRAVLRAVGFLAGPFILGIGGGDLLARALGVALSLRALMSWPVPFGAVLLWSLRAVLLWALRAGAFLFWPRQLARIREVALALNHDLFVFLGTFRATLRRDKCSEQCNNI